ncbi:MAG: protein-glutamate methylesterase/protein-glutamine glutaminase [Myxococcota bacterium]
MIKVLIVDDSAVVRRISSRILSSAGDIEVVGTAPDPYVARDLIVTRQPDVVTLDVEMPRMDGITFLKKLMQHYPLPVVIVSTLTTKGGEVALEAMAAGAVEVICKPGNESSLHEMGEALIDAVRSAWLARNRVRRGEGARAAQQATAVHRSLAEATRQLIAIGASTGGTVAIETILQTMPPDTPGIVMVQHMPAFFTRSFADRLSRLCRIRVREAADGDLIEKGLALLAPGDRQMVVRSSPRGWMVGVLDGPRVSGHRPSVDVLFRSVARAAGNKALGVILTGMGADGAAGLAEMRKAGAHTLGQDEETSVVYGMPRAAFDLGAVEAQVPLQHMTQRILAAL